jgi:hypothetical protein
MTTTATATVTDRQIRTLQAEADTAGDIVQAVICRVALDDLECSDDEADADGLPDYSGGGHSTEELRQIHAALRLSVDEARAKCARVIRDAAAQA